MKYSGRFFIIMFSLFFCLERAVAEDTISLQDLVIPVSASMWERESPQGRFPDEMRYMLRQNNKYTVNKWYYGIKRFQDQSGEYLDFGGNTEHFIRPASHHVFTLALCLKLHVYDPQITFVSEEKALDIALNLIRSLAYHHKSNIGEGGWGDQWQSALWAAQVANAGWFLWNELSVSDRELLCRMLVHEANRFIDYEVPYYRDISGNIMSEGDTKAEENAWNSNILTIATAMMPHHEHHDHWMAKNVELQISAYATPEDINKDTVVDGVKLNQILKGSNMNSNGTVINHNILHPDYMTAFMHNAINVWIYELAGRNGLQSSLYNGAIIYNALTEQQFNGKTMYQKSNDGKASSLIYFPEGNDWGGKRQANYWLMDVMAYLYGWDHKSSVKAIEWATVRNTEMIHMINRDVTGQYYQDIKEDKFPSREEWFGSHIMWGYLGWWLHH